MRMLPPGTLAPDFDALDQHQQRVSLSGIAPRLCTVLYFFPKAFTRNCTRETIRFRDNYRELEAIGVAVIGVSTDDPDIQCKFAESLQTPFPMLGDPRGAIAKAYKARWPVIGLAQRITYVLSPGRIVLRSFHHEFQITKHTDDVFQFVDELSRATQAVRD